MPLPVQTLAAAPDSQQFGKQLIDEGGWGIDLVLETDMEFGHGKTCLSSQSLASVAQLRTQPKTSQRFCRSKRVFFVA